MVSQEPRKMVICIVKLFTGSVVQCNHVNACSYKGDIKEYRWTHTCLVTIIIKIKSTLLFIAEICWFLHTQDWRIIIKYIYIYISVPLFICLTQKTYTWHILFQSSILLIFFIFFFSFLVKGRRSVFLFSCLCPCVWKSDEKTVLLIEIEHIWNNSLWTIDVQYVTGFISPIFPCLFIGMTSDFFMHFLLFWFMIMFMNKNKWALFMFWFLFIYLFYL